MTSSSPKGSLVSVCADISASSETFVRREADGLRGLGWRVGELGLRQAAADPAVRGAPPVPAAALRSALAALPLRQMPALLRRARIASFLASRTPRPDLLLAQFAWVTADVCVLASKLSGIPWACRVHAWDVFAQPLPVLRRRLSTASLLLPCTQAAADRLEEAGLPPGRIRLVRHGVPGSGQAFPGDAPPPASREKTVLAVGRLEEKKGFDTLLHAFARLRDILRDDAQLPDLHILGDGTLRRRLERLSVRLGLSVGFSGACPHPVNREPSTVNREPSTVFFGACPPSRVANEMGRAAMLVLPSRRLPSGDRDGVANVLLEAMAAGLPVITTTAGCAGEIVEDGRNGLLLPPDDPDALASAIARLLADAPLRASLAAGGRETLRTRLSPSETIGRLSDALSIPCGPAGLFP